MIQGNMLVVPIEESILYVQPIYLAGDIGALPEFKKVIVVFGDRIVMRDSLPEALAAVFGDAPPVDDGGTDTPTTPDDPGTLPDDVQVLLEEVDLAFQRADAALRNGDLATYQVEIQNAERLIEQIRAILAPEPEEPETAPADSGDTADA